MRKIETRHGILDMLREFEKNCVELTDELLTVDINIPEFRDNEGKLVGIGLPNGGDKYFIESSFGEYYSNDRKYYREVSRCLFLSIKKFLDNLIPGENLNTLGKIDSTKTLSSYVRTFEEAFNLPCLGEVEESKIDSYSNHLQHITNVLFGYVNRYIDLINWGGENVKLENIPMDVATFFLDLKDLSIHINLNLSSNYSNLKELDFNSTKPEIDIREMSVEYKDEIKLLHKAIMEYDFMDKVEDKYRSSLEALEMIREYVTFGKNIKYYKTKYSGTFNIILSLIGDVYVKEYLRKCSKKDSQVVNKYVKKPVEIEAIQLSNDTKEEVHNFVGKSLTFNKYGAVVKTLEGEMSCEFGDYIIKGVRGEFYPCKKEIFEETYS